MGIDERNWPARVGTLGGVFAKEAVVGSLGALCSEIGDRPRPGAAGPGPADEPFDLGHRLAEALATAPANLGALASRLGDPPGVTDSGGGETASDEVYEWIGAAAGNRLSNIAGP